MVVTHRVVDRLAAAGDHHLVVATVLRPEGHPALRPEATVRPVVLRPEATVRPAVLRPAVLRPVVQVRARRPGVGVRQAGRYLVVVGAPPVALLRARLAATVRLVARPPVAHRRGCREAPRLVTIRRVRRPVVDCHPATFLPALHRPGATVLPAELRPVRRARAATVRPGALLRLVRPVVTVRPVGRQAAATAGLPVTVPPAVPRPGATVRLAAGPPAVQGLAGEDRLPAIPAPLAPRPPPREAELAGLRWRP